MLYWLSYCDFDLLDNERFLGGIIVEADSLEQAKTVAVSKEVNPGGQIFSGEIPDNIDIPEEYRNVFLSHADIKQLEKYWEEEENK